jgi:hypothetical protein
MRVETIGHVVNFANYPVAELILLSMAWMAGRSLRHGLTTSQRHHGPYRRRFAQKPAPVEISQWR